MRKMELLAPAGGREQLEYAIHFGADAVFLGGSSFGLRSRAENFDDTQLRDAVDYAHEHGVKVHTTVNTLLHNEDLVGLPRHIKNLSEAGVDAIIAADLATVDIAQEVAPDLEIHVSTQASVTNYRTAMMWQRMGAKRIVLARELGLDEIKEIKENVPEDLEIETFVHGAMCMSYSGRCIISNFLTNRDANRGECTQPCRWRYSLMEEKRPGITLPIFEKENSTFILNSKDLMMLGHLQDLSDAGVDSLKIEGRMKGAYYVATVVNAYRHVLDGGDPQEFMRDLNAISHRPYHTGFYYGPAEQTFDDYEYRQTHDLVAVATKSVKQPDGSWYIDIIQRNRFFEGDTLEVISPKFSTREVEIKDLHYIPTNKDTGNPGVPEHQDTAKKSTHVYRFTSTFPLEPGDIMRREREDIDRKA